MRLAQIQPPSFDDFDNNSAQQEVYEYESTGSGIVSSAYNVPLSIVNDTHGAWFGLFSVALGVSAIIFTVVLYSIFRLVQIRIAERERFAAQAMSPEVELLLGHKEPTGTVQKESQITQRWSNVQRHAESENINDWRLAILEADIMLNDLITSMGYVGEGLGEKLKQVSQTDLNSIEYAWEAHKMRNKIAHEGSAYELNKREVKRVIGLYERVFREAKFI